MASTPSVDYTSRDFEGLKQTLLDFAAVRFPDWKPSSEGDFGVLMIELLSYVGDLLSYYVDRAQNEAYLPTATQRSSVLQIASLLGYRPNNGTPARGTVYLKTLETSPATSVPAGTRLLTEYVSDLDSPIFFETETTLLVPANGGSSVAFTVVEGETKKDETSGGPLTLGSSNGLASQSFRLPHPKVYEDSVQVFVGGEEWIYIDHLLDADPTEKRFTLITSADGYTTIQFGDGINGAIPAIGLDVATLYRVGVGALGNVAAGTVIGIFDELPGVIVELNADDSTSTSTEMTGGADPESTKQIRNNAPKVFATQQRAINPVDYEAFALSVPGVSKANATAGTFSSVSLFVVGPDGLTATSRLLDAVQAELATRTLAGVTTSVASATTVGVNVTASIVARPTYSRLQVEFDAAQAVKDVLSFDYRDIGDTLTVSDVYSKIMSLPGVLSANVSLMARADAVQSGTTDIQFLPYELGTQGTVTLTSTGGIG